MSDFVLEISGVGECISLEPVGTIDVHGARALLDALDSLREGRRAPFLEIRLDRVDGCTAEAWRVLATSELPVEVLAATSG